MIKNILFIFSGNSYVSGDLEILKKYYNVITYRFNNSKNVFLMLFEYLKFFYFLLLNIKKFNLYFIWFADYHSFPPVFVAKIFKKKSIINLGGYDVTYIPELNYGAFNNPIRSFLTGFSIKHASINLAVASNLKKEALERIPSANIKVLPTGYDFSYFFCKTKKKENIIITVAKVDSYKRFKIKGMDFFLLLANSMPEYNFIAIGIEDKALKYFKKIPKNLKIYPSLSRDSLLDFYCKAKVYAQFSLREGFPSAVCEAMLCGCIPVATNVGAIEEIIGNTGYILSKRTLSEAKKLIKLAIDSPLDLADKVHSKIMNNFSIEKREKGLLHYINLIEKNNVYKGKY